MKIKSGRKLLIGALLFACWLQFPVGLHIKESIPGVVATCVETGLTEGKKCVLCGKLLTAQQVIPATGLHVYDNDFDKSCNDCSYEREVSSKFDFVNHRVVLEDENNNHKNWRVTVYKLGSQLVEENTDEYTLEALDSEAKTYWGIPEINRIVLTDAGNYILLLKYNVGANVAIKVPMALTITDEPKLIVDGDNRITVFDKNTANKNHTLTIYYMGNVKIANPADEKAVKDAAVSEETYTDIQSMNETAITLGGNYVFWLSYDAADGTKRTITIAEELISRPALRVDAENRLVASCDDESITNFRAFVYYLGDQTVTDVYDEAALKKSAGPPVVYWGLNKINSAMLEESGTYVIHLQYNIGTGSKKTVAMKFTIGETNNDGLPEGEPSLF